MKFPGSRSASVAFTGLLALATTTAQPVAKPPNLRGIGFDQQLNAQVPLSTLFRDESGQSVALSAFFGRKPVILATVYYRCPMLCSQVLSGVVRGLRPLSLKPGKDFEVIALSIDPEDSSNDAASKRRQYSRSYSSTAGTAGWHFLTGSDHNIRAATDAIGFHFRYDPKTKMFLHASGITVLTPEGRVSRYLYGVDYEPKDLKLSLIDASHERIGSAVDQVLLFCYHYDPSTGKYGLLVVNALKLASLLTLVVMAVGSTLLWRRDLRDHAADKQRLRDA